MRTWGCVNVYIIPAQSVPPNQKMRKIPKCEIFDNYILTDLRMVVSEVMFSVNMLYWLPIQINLLAILIETPRQKL